MKTFMGTSILQTKRNSVVTPKYLIGTVKKLLPESHSLSVLHSLVYCPFRPSSRRRESLTILMK